MNAPLTSTNVLSVAMQEGLQPNPVLTEGKGEPVVYLHGLLGQEWNGLLGALAKSRRVLAPAHVGIAEADDLRQFDGFHDLVLYYDDLFDRLGLDQFDLIGHSFGGMVAAEYAAVFNKRVRKLVLIDPLGLWRDDLPVSDYLLLPPEKQNELLIGDPANEAVQAKVAVPEDQQQMIDQMLGRMMSVAGASHFIWPIPERGLAKRLPRIKAKTLIVWGAEDKFVPGAYAQDFAGRIADARIEVIGGAGHSPHIEREADTVQKIAGFLG